MINMRKGNTSSRAASLLAMFADLRATDVIAAADRIRPLIKRTDLLRSAALSEVAGGDVYLKLENTQTTGSFKLRGAMSRLSALTESERAGGVLTVSAGNHGLAVAHCSSLLGIDATIIVPRIPTETLLIQAVKLALPNCAFDRDECQEGIACLDNHKREWDDKAGVWRETPARTPFKHGADAFGQYAVMLEDLKRLGHTQKLPQEQPTRKPRTSRKPRPSWRGV